MRSVRPSLFSRLSASTAALAVTIVFVAVAFFQLSHGQLFRTAFSAALGEWSVAMARGIGDDPEIAQRAAIAHQIYVLVELPSGTYAYDPEGRPIDPKHLAGLDGFRRLDAPIPEPAAGPKRKYSFFLDDAEATQRHRKLLFGLVALLLATVGIAYFVHLSQLKPLRWLRDGVEAVAEGRLDTRVPVLRQDEIGRVGAAFNQMTERVQRMLGEREQLLADVSHELRSPLARIKVALELLPEGTHRDAIDRDLRSMERLTTLLLQRQRLGEAPERRPTDLVAVARDVLAGFDTASFDTALLTAPPIRLVTDRDEIVADVDPEAFRILLANLVDNAVKASTPDSDPVEVHLASDEADEVVLRVDDDGPGIPSADAERVFEPFVKLDPARGHRRGFGLGLDLCRRIASAHGGRIALAPRPGGGTRAEVRIPKR